jgi:MFS family permease
MTDTLASNTAEGPKRRRGPRPGTARAAWAHRDFRVMWIGSFGSNVGTWMQNVILPPFAYKLAERTGGMSPGAYSGLIIVAQLGPMLLAPIAGELGDRFARRPLLVLCQIEQLVFSLVLAWLVSGQPSKSALFFVALAVGIGSAMQAPAWSAMIPNLVPFRDLQGAISLNSTMINGSRVVGPLLVVALSELLGIGAPGVFVINAVTYLFVVIALFVAHPGRAPASLAKEAFTQRLSAGVREGRRNPIVGRILVVLPLFSLFCLPYVGQFQTIAERNLGTDSEGGTYRWLYATWGLGACLGGLAISTILAKADKRVLPRVFLVAFGATMVVFAHLTRPVPAFPVGFLLGFCYFSITTSMVTVLQQRVDPAVRARVLALYFVGFGGTIPIGSWIGGWLMDRWGVTPVLNLSAVAAVLIAGLASFKAIDEHHPVADIGTCADPASPGAHGIAGTTLNP